MKENTVYLLYNTDASNVKLHHGLVTNFNRKSREWEYEDKDEFTIMYSPDDERKYTDIKILSKTKLRERPKSADQLLLKKPKISVEGILIRRSNSLSTIEEDLFVLRRCPQIKPLLSETEIQQLQLLLKECRRNKQVLDKTDSKSNISQGLLKLFTDYQDLRTSTGDLKSNYLYKSPKDVPTKRTQSVSPHESYSNNERKKTNISSHVTKKDNTGKTKSLDKWREIPKSVDKYKKNKILNSTKFTKEKTKSHLTNVTEEVKPKKQDFLGSHHKSKDRSKHDKRKSRTVFRDEGIKKHSNKTSKTQQPPEQNKLKKKNKTTHEDENHKNNERNSKTDNDKPKEEIDRATNYKENFSKQSLLKHSSEKTSGSKLKEPKKTINDRTKSKGDITKLKKNKDFEKSDSIIKQTDKSDRSKMSKHKILDQPSKDEKKPKSSTVFPSKEKSKKYEIDQMKTLDETYLVEDLLVNKKSEKSAQSKSSPSDKSKTTNKTEGPQFENASANKGKTKDKLLPGTIQYIIHYILSNPIFINLGWTLQSTKKALSRIVTFKALPANSQSYCFRRRDNDEHKLYPSGALALHIAEDGTGRINYPGGAPAISITRSHGGMKLTIYSCPKKDPLIKKSFYTRIIGMFDSFGNGVVYDSNGKKVLCFNQMEGIYYGSSKLTPYKWQWSCCKVLKAQRLKELLNTMVREGKQSAPTTKGDKVLRAPSNGSSRKSITILEKKPVDRIYQALLEELPYPVMPKPKLKIKTHDNAFKSIILKINKETTLRINGQDSVAVNFSGKSLFCKMNLGVRIDPEIVERVDEAADNSVESVPNVLCDLLHPSPSLLKLHELLDPDTVL